MMLFATGVACPLYPAARVRPWIFRIAKNACLMKRRKNVFAPDHELSLDEFMPTKSQEGGQTKLQIADCPPREALRLYRTA
jgi:DNA-directed RNA polymerase specialized sigma24 family protein